MSDSDVHPLVRNAAVATILATVLIPAAALALGASIYAIRFAITGDVAMPAMELGPQTQMLVILAVVGGYGFLVWMAIRETFGGEDVDEGVESALDTADAVDQRREQME